MWKYNCMIWTKNHGVNIFHKPEKLIQIFTFGSNILFVHLWTIYLQILKMSWWNNIITWSLYLRCVFITVLSHCGWAMHICVGKLTINGSDNGFLPGRRQAFIWIIAAILLIGPLGTNFSGIIIGIQTFSLKKKHLKMSSAKWRPFVSASKCWVP